MTAIELSFDSKDSKGNNLGDFEMFVDLTSSVANPTTIKLVGPTDYLVKGIKLFQATESQGGGVSSSPDKQAAITQCQQGNWTTVFDGQLPDGFTYDSSTTTLTDTGASQGVFEYLVWLQHETDGSYDFADPGIRNH